MKPNDTIPVVRYGDDRARPVTIRWAGVADVDFGDGLGLRSNVPVALAVDDGYSPRDIAIARNLDVDIADDGAIVDLTGHVTRDWTTIDGEPMPRDIGERVDAALAGRPRSKPDTDD